MTEEKIFWKVGKNETLNASEVKIMYVDGNALLWGYIEDGNVSEWYKCDDTDAEFFRTEAEANDVAKKNRQALIGKLKTATEFIEEYHNCDYLTEGLEGEEKENVEGIIKTYRDMHDCDDGRISRYQANGLVTRAIDIVLNKKAIVSDAVMFYFNDIEYVEYCKDEKNKKYFYKAYIKGRMVKVYKPEHMTIFKHIFDIDTMRFTCNGELNFLND